MLVPHFVGVYGIRGSRGGGYIRPLPPEYHIPVHRDLPDTGAVSGGGAVAENAVGTEVVVQEGIDL